MVEFLSGFFVHKSLVFCEGKELFKIGNSFQPKFLLIHFLIVPKVELEAGTDGPRAFPLSLGAWGPGRDRAGTPCPDLPDFWPSSIRFVIILKG